MTKHSIKSRRQDKEQMHGKENMGLFLILAFFINIISNILLAVQRVSL
jgi:hypothetical protein